MITTKETTDTNQLIESNAAANSCVALTPNPLRSRRILFASFSMLLLTICTGCIETKVPLTDPKSSKADARLAGDWIESDEKDDPTRLTILSAGKNFPSGMQKCVSIGSGETESTTELFFTTKIGRNRYMNFVSFKDDAVPSKWDSKAVTHYVVLPYRIERGKLEFCCDETDEAHWNNAHKAGADGRLKDFLQKHGDKLFASEEGSAFHRPTDRKNGK